MIIGISGKIGSGKDTVGLLIQYLTSPNGFGGIGGKLEFVEEFIKTYEGKKLDGEWEVKKWADKLKDIVCILIGCTREQLENRDFKEAPLGKEWDRYQIQFTYPNGEVDSNLYGLCFTHEEAVEFEKNERRALQWPSSLKTEVVKVQMTPRLMLQLLGTDCGRDIIHSNVWVNSLMADYKKELKSNRPFHRLELVTEEGDDIKFTEEYPNWLITDTRFPNEAEAVLDKGGILIRVNRGDGNTGDHPSETSLDNYKKWTYVIDNNRTLKDLFHIVKEILIKEGIL